MCVYLLVVCHVLCAKIFLILRERLVTLERKKKLGYHHIQSLLHIPISSLLRFHFAVGCPQCWSETPFFTISVRCVSLFWQLIAVIALLCVPFLFENGNEKLLSSISTKGSIVCYIGIYTPYKSFGLLDERVACVALFFRVFSFIRSIGLFRHFGLTIAFCIQTIWFCTMWQKPSSNNSKNAGNNIIRLMTLVNKILSLSQRTDTNHRMAYEKHIKVTSFHPKRIPFFILFALGCCFFYFFKYRFQLYLFTFE